MKLESKLHHVSGVYKKDVTSPVVQMPSSFSLIIVIIIATYNKTPELSLKFPAAIA